MSTLAIFILCSFAGSLAGAVAWRLWTQRTPSQRFLNEDRRKLPNTESFTLFHAGDNDRD